MTSDAWISRLRSAWSRPKALATMMAGVMIPTTAATTCWSESGMSWEMLGVPSWVKRTEERSSWAMVPPESHL